ncbi:hypothetical protein [Spongiactinospora sp. TRM90649]|uniref:hypothetical protein n=1 Tax=Spongiactinospora sp. TRM90649 TaxID=3031114 RepID=UPI0023F9C2BA|nr:hypothetical protein [Spongiactinospora sp. TRM90649]MDF5758628.1 hypothetical protein [Spongiactinospora sp. TRM90649]
MRHLVLRLPVWIRAQPLDCMFALLGILPGVASLAGLATSRALETLLPWWAAQLWALILIVGCGCWLAGASSVRERDGHLVASRLPLFLLGLRLLSLACLVYAVAIVVISGWAGLLAAYPLLVGAAGLYIRRVGLTR